MKRTLISKVALGRVAQPEDIAKVIVFLMSNESGYISGSVSRRMPLFPPSLGCKNYE